jgi:hypothetical protein
MALALAAGLVLAAAARAAEQPTPIGLQVAGGEEWHAVNDFRVFWTNPAGNQFAGASWRISGPAFSGGAQFTPGPDLTELDHLRVPAAGGWELRVWLRDAGGWESEPLAAVAKLLFDDVAPAVSFMPGGSGAPPPQLVAAVADPLSGLADGGISYCRLDQERWADLPTQIRVGAFGTELVAATPELKPSTAYLFRAEARDGAGNVGTTTLRADGSPMSLRAPDAAPGSGSGSAGAARRTRLVVGLGGGRGGDRARTSLTIGPGEAAVLRGRLSPEGDGNRDDGGGLAGHRLRIVTRPARGARTGVGVESVTTGPSGRFELRLPPGPSRRIGVVFPGGEGLRPARRRLALRVRAAVSLRAAPRRLETGGLVLLGGRVGSRGTRIPRSGKLVTISYWERAARRWRPVILTRTDREGRFRASYRFRYLTGRARIRLRATAPAEADWPYAPGSSRPVTLEVSG